MDSGVDRILVINEVGNVIASYDDIQSYEYLWDRGYIAITRGNGIVTVPCSGRFIIEVVRTAAG